MVTDMSDKKAVSYLDFGAVGDGVTDDFRAIYRAHEYANEHNLPVVTDDDKTYYIHDTVIDGEVKTVKIRTDVNWGSSKFIIDDNLECSDGLKRGARSIFKVVSDYEDITVTDPEILEKFKGVGEGTKRFDFAPGYPALITVYNDNYRVYHRTGYASKGGRSSPQHEVFLVDKDGNIDESTPFMFNYDEVTKIIVTRVDVTPLTVKGGIFTTLVPVVSVAEGEVAKVLGGYTRNILVNRSYTTVEGVSHYVENEPTIEDWFNGKYHGVHYAGFYTASFANEVTFKDCIITGRRSYNHSTYEFRADHINKIRLVGCTQCNFEIIDEDGNKAYSMKQSKFTRSASHWGIGGSNFCKNMEYIDCKVSRFDAHQGLYNGKIINTDVNMMEIIGKGELILENMRWRSANPGKTYNSFLYLKADYGSTWEGTITAKNCTLDFSEGEAFVFFHGYVNWNFGYTCYFPNIIIDNPTVRGLKPGAKIDVVRREGSFTDEPNMHFPKTKNKPAIRHDGTIDEGNMTNQNPNIPPKFIKVINNNSGHDFHIYDVPFFESTEKVGLVEENF